MNAISVSLQPSRGLVGFLRSVFMRKSADSLLELSEQQKLLDEVKEARQELECIQSYFNWVCDPDLVEYAIYQERAIKLKYSYLVKLAKEKNIKSLNFTLV